MSWLDLLLKLPENSAVRPGDIALLCCVFFFFFWGGGGGGGIVLFPGTVPPMQVASSDGFINTCRLNFCSM